jgi:hypothetical protein
MHCTVSLPVARVWLDGMVRDSKQSSVSFTPCSILARFIRLPPASFYPPRPCISNLPTDIPCTPLLSSVLQQLKEDMRSFQAARATNEKKVPNMEDPIDDSASSKRVDEKTSKSMKPKADQVTHPAPHTHCEPHRVSPPITLHGNGHGPSAAPLTPDTPQVPHPACS